MAQTIEEANHIGQQTIFCRAFKNNPKIDSAVEI